VTDRIGEGPLLGGAVQNHTFLPKCVAWHTNVPCHVVMSHHHTVANFERGPSGDCRASF
jgi:hypothetical protein